MRKNVIIFIVALFSMTLQASPQVQPNTPPPPAVIDFTKEIFIYDQLNTRDGYLYFNRGDATKSPFRLNLRSLREKDILPEMMWSYATGVKNQVPLRFSLECVSPKMCKYTADKNLQGYHNFVSGYYDLRFNPADLKTLLNGIYPDKSDLNPKGELMMDLGTLYMISEEESFYYLATTPTITGQTKYYKILKDNILNDRTTQGRKYLAANLSNVPGLMRLQNVFYPQGGAPFNIKCPVNIIWDPNPSDSSNQFSKLNICSLKGVLPLDGSPAHYQMSGYVFFEGANQKSPTSPAPTDLAKTISSKTFIFDHLDNQGFLHFMDGGAPFRIETRFIKEVANPLVLRFLPFATQMKDRIPLRMRLGCLNSFCNYNIRNSVFSGAYSLEFSQRDFQKLVNSKFPPLRVTSLPQKYYDLVEGETSFLFRDTPVIDGKTRYFTINKNQLFKVIITPNGPKTEPMTKQDLDLFLQTYSKDYLSNPSKSHSIIVGCLSEERGGCSANYVLSDDEQKKPSAYNLNGPFSIKFLDSKN